MRRSPRSHRSPAGSSQQHLGTPEFLQVRALAIEAYYSDFVAPGVDATGAWAEIDFNTPLATRLAKDWSYLDQRRRLDEPHKSEAPALPVPDRGRRALRRRGRRLRRGRRRRGRRARGPRPARAPARGRPAQDRGRLHALGGEGGARSLVADPVRADRRRRRWCRRPDRRPLRRRLDHDQHEGCPARAREGPGQVARGERARRSTGRPSALRPRPALRAGGEAARRPRAHRLAEERRAPSSPASVRSARSSSRCTPTPTRTACAAAPACRAARRTRASRRSTRTSTTPGRRAGSSCAPTRASTASDRRRRGGGRRVRRADGTVKRVDAGAVVVAAGTLNTPQLLLRSGLPDSASSRSDRPQPRLPPGASRLRAVRRAAGRAHGVPDHGARDGSPARRGRRFRDRGDDDPGSDRLRDDARGRERPALGRGSRRGGARVPPLGRPARDGQRRQQRQRAARRERARSRSTAAFTAPERERMDGALEFTREVLLGRRAPRASAGPG